MEPTTMLPSEPAATADGTIQGQKGSRLAPPSSLTMALRIPVDRLRPDPDQPRTSFDADELLELAQSFKRHGQLAPIMVRIDDQDRDRYIVIDGERRFRAATQAGLTTLACVAKLGLGTKPDERLIIQLAANACRAGIKPIEQARAFNKLMVSGGLTQQELADKLGIKQHAVSRALELLELPEAIQRDVETGTIPPSTAVELGKIDDAAAQAALANRAVAEGLSRDAVAAEVRKVKPEVPRKRNLGNREVATASGFRERLRSLVASQRSRGLDPPAVLDVLREVASDFEDEHRPDLAE